MDWLNSTSLIIKSGKNDSILEMPGGIEYFLKYLDETLPYTLLNLIGLLVGSFGNILIMGAILLTKELQNDTGILIFNLSLAELLITGFVNFFTILGVFVGKKFFVLMSALCDFIGAICLIACVTSLMNIGFLAINRYLIICHNKLYHRLFTHKKTIVYCVINWLIGILVDLPNFTGWGGHYYDSKTISCIWNRLKSHSYSIFFPTTSIIIPCACILICYIKIFVFAKNSRNKVMSLSRNEKKRGYGRSIKLAKGLFGSFILFTACWLPYGLIVMIDFKDQLPRSGHMFSLAIAHFNSTLNPIFFGASNKNFRKGYKKFIEFILNKFKIKSFNNSEKSTVHTSRMARIHEKSF